MLDQELITPERYDSVEQPRKGFDPDGWREAAELYRRDGLLFVSGGSGEFRAMFGPSAGVWSEWELWVELGSFQTDSSGWLEWLFGLCEQLPVLFGYGCSEAEFMAKHSEAETFDNGGSVEGWVGSSSPEFRDYLPGLYWLTIFGPELTGHFDVSAVERVGGVGMRRLAQDQVALHLDDPVVPLDMNDRLRKEAELAELLGVEYFFDRNRKDLRFRQVPALLATLDALAIRRDGRA
jgi:hypothetical protein